MAGLIEQVLIIDHRRLLLQGGTDELREQGATIAGPAAEVGRFTSHLWVLNTSQLGPTRSATVFGTLSGDDRRQAARAGLEIGPVPLRALFVHLTDPDRPLRGVLHHPRWPRRHARSALRWPDHLAKGGR